MILIDIGILTITAFFIMSIRLWFSENVTGLRRKHARILLLCMGMCTAVPLAVYTYILPVLGLDAYDPILLKTTYQFGGDYLRTSIFIRYTFIAIVVLVNTLLVRRSHHVLLVYVALTSTALISMYVVQDNIFKLMSTVLIYYICIAYSEEVIKQTTAQSFANRYGSIKNDILGFSLLGAIAFATIENIFYAIHVLASEQSIGAAVTLLAIRGVVGYLMHILFSGIIAWGQMRKRYTLIFCSAIGIGLHMSYDIIADGNYTILFILFLLIGYIRLSYILYKTDRLYLVRTSH